MCYVLHSDRFAEWARAGPRVAVAKLAAVRVAKDGTLRGWGRRGFSRAFFIQRFLGPGLL